MSSDSRASTPAPITPDSTGTTDASAKKLRRQTAFYPNMKSSTKPLKPFSRSAAKRESVMTLGSIEYLQHYFTKTGIQAQQDPKQKQRKGLVPALGGLTLNSAAMESPPQTVTELPPTPAAPERPKASFPPYVKTFETDPQQLRPGVIEDLTATARAWSLDDDTSRTRSDPNLLGVGDKGKGRASSNFDVLSTLKITTHAIRSVRNYLISLPDDSIDRIRDDYRPRVTPGKPIQKRQKSQAEAQSDPLTLIRRSALDVLTVLRRLEETSRLPLTDDAYDAQSDHGSVTQDAGGTDSRVGSPTGRSDDADRDDNDLPLTFSLVKVRGRDESVPVWEDDASDINDVTDEHHEKKDRWDERLILGGGWLYKQELQLEDLVKEREVVKHYLDSVDDVLFGGTKNGRRGWEREAIANRSKSRRASAGDVEHQDEERKVTRKGRRIVSAGIIESMRDMMVTEEPEPMESLPEEPSDEVPDWADSEAYADDPLGRAYALLTALLPHHLVSILPPSPSDRAGLLHALSSGQLLCVAYNAGVRQSRKPWGFINKHEIHDLVALENARAEAEEKGKAGWTYRRLDNLRLWAGGLKLRYSLPILILPKATSNAGLRTPQIGTPAASPSPGSVRFPATATEPPFTFDTRAIARRDEGWEEVLETALIRWMNAVAGEKRGER